MIERSVERKSRWTKEVRFHPGHAMRREPLQFLQAPRNRTGSFRKTPGCRCTTRRRRVGVSDDERRQVRATIEAAANAVV